MDGLKVFLANRYTDNVSVFDWNSMTVDTNLSVGDYPSAVAVSDNYLLVACQFSDQLWIFDMNDYSLIDTIPTAEQPCRIQISHDQQKAFVACDIDDICHVIELGTFEILLSIPAFPIYLQTFSWATQSSRNWAKYNDFVVDPGDDYLIIPDGSDHVKYFDIEDGSLYQQTDIDSPRALALSGDESSLVCAANPDGTARVYQLDPATGNITKEVAISGFSLQTNEIVANQDGSKAFIGTNNNSSTLVRFDTQDFINFSQTYTPFWMDVSYDHLYAISGQYRFSVLDFENETITGQVLGYNQSFGCISPVDYHAFGCDPLLYEGGHFNDFSDPDNIDFRGSSLSGELPEGDAPCRVALTHSRAKAMSVNNLSYNCSIINTLNNEVEAVIQLGEACYDVEITPDDKWAVIGGYNNNTVKIVDINTHELAAEIYTGQRPMEISISPDGQYAYAGNIKSNTLSMIELDGENSSVLSSKYCGVIGVYIPFFGVRSDIEVSPDGSLVLVAASFDDQVNIFDTSTRDFIASVDVGDFPLSIAMTDDGQYACVSNLFEHNLCILEMDGANTTVMTYTEINGDYPVEVEYNPVDSLFYVITYQNKRIHKIRPETGEVVESVYYNPYGTIFQLDFTDAGEPVVLAQGDEDHPSALIFQEMEYELPAVPAAFDMAASDYFAAVAMPGPDFVSLVELMIVPGMEEKPAGEQGSFSIYPNPAWDKIQIRSELACEEIRIFDAGGRLVYENTWHPGNPEVDVSHLENGMYFVIARSGKQTKKLSFVKQ
ncbi:MAG: T9SS type A sorting domain-containing protein [Bacteroidota bacterium]|nr:T9SS type A sorting domain-containing protein [Bacteroidota bacterium]